jgi:hypothetical protein
MAILPQQTAGPKIFPAAEHREGDVGVHGVAGDPEARGNFLVGQAVIFA